MTIKTIDSKYQLLLAVLITTLLSFFITWVFAGLLSGLITATICFIVLFIARNVWFSDKGNFILRLSVLNIVALVIGFSNSLVQPLILGIIKSYLPFFKIPDITISPFTYLFLLGLVLIVFYFTNDKTVLGQESKNVNKFITAPDFKQRFKMVCEALADDIRKVDKDTNWSIQYFTPLDAEVEISQTNGLNKKIVKDLIDALKQTDDRLILIVGDPGSGKSVALRKLCLDLLNSEEKNKTFKIPIYINLKEWVADRTWTEEAPPTFDEIKNFVLENLKNRDIVTRDFFDEYFDILYEKGNLFFIFDSFDEIPAILSTSHESLLIDKTSLAFNQFLKGARQPMAQGILSSREFRRPTDSFMAKTKLTIRPFSIKKINSTLSISARLSDNKIKELFIKRPDLVIYARNPFTASLLSNYLNKNNEQFPLNLAEIYEHYITETISISCKEKLIKHNISLDAVISFMQCMGEILFEKSSLEVSIIELRDKIRGDKFYEIIEVLKFARICRESQGINRLLSFSHRRFCEFFAVKNLINKESINYDILEDIPKDSLWRDTLALYCMVAPEQKAKSIAEYCWNIIKSNDKLMNNNAIHSLRFLIDAFQTRKECLISFHDDLSDLILKNIDKENIISTILSVEALCLLPLERIDSGTAKALEFKNNLVNECSLRGCRHLNSISDNLEKNLISSFGLADVNSLIDLKLVIQNYDKKEFLFSLSLSEAFNEVLKSAKWMYVKYYLSLMFSVLIPSIYFFSVPSFFDLNQSFSILTVIVIFFVRLVFILFLALICSILITDLLGLLLLYKNSYKSQLINFTSLSKFSYTALIIYILNKFSEVAIYISYIILIFMILLIFKYIYANIKNWKNIFKYKINFSIFNLPGISYINSYFQFKEIVLADNSTRENIYNNFKKLNSTFQAKYLAYLENNVKKVTGKYPTNELLKVSENRNLDRLAKLELKWRDIEK